MSFKKIAVLALVFTFIISVSRSQDKTELKTSTDTLSYAIGLNVGNSIKNLSKDSIVINTETLIAGLKAVMEDKTTMITTEQATAALMNLQKEMQAKQQEKIKMEAGVNKMKCENFLAENKQKPGVVTLPDGLQYKILTEGKGPKPSTSSQVKVDYKGTLIDGTGFDSSYVRGPATFPVTGVIKGWTEALQLMPEGSEWELYIPSELAYGDRGAGQAIGPDEALIFKVKLLQVINKDEKLEVAPVEPKNDAVPDNSAKPKKKKK